jgi:hypothetical protein
MLDYWVRFIIEIDQREVEENLGKFIPDVTFFYPIQYEKGEEVMDRIILSGKQACSVRFEEEDEELILKEIQGGPIEMIPQNTIVYFP